MAVQDYSFSSGTNFNVRVDGAIAGDGVTFVAMGDLDNDGRPDLLIKSWWADNNSRSNSGSLWIIYNTLLETLASSGTGNTIVTGTP